jgi:hypothetical protein
MEKMKCRSSLIYSLILICLMLPVLFLGCWWIAPEDRLVHLSEMGLSPLVEDFYPIDCGGDEEVGLAVSNGKLFVLTPGLLYQVDEETGIIEKEYSVDLNDFSTEDDTENWVIRIQAHDPVDMPPFLYTPDSQVIVIDENSTNLEVSSLFELGIVSAGTVFENYYFTYSGDDFLIAEGRLYAQSSGNTELAVLPIPAEYEQNYSIAYLNSSLFVCGVKKNNSDSIEALFTANIAEFPMADYLEWETLAETIWVNSTELQLSTSEAFLPSQFNGTVLIPKLKSSSEGFLFVYNAPKHAEYYDLQSGELSRVNIYIDGGPYAEASAISSTGDFLYITSNRYTGVYKLRLK